jgi:hypothetical protein
LKNNNIHIIISGKNSYKLIKLFLLILLLHVSLLSTAQQKFLIKGIIIEEKDNTPIPFAYIILLNSKTGTISQNDGKFTLQVPKIPDTIQISMVGFETVHIPIKNKHQDFYEIKLTPSKVELGEVVILPKEDRINYIMKRVIKLREKNNPLNAKTIACNTYTKVMANAVSDKDTNFRQQSGLPIFFSEKFAQNYIQRNPYYEKENVIYEKISGLGLFSELDVLGISRNTLTNFNFYENTIEVFNKPFISPISKNAFSYYYFFLRDTIIGKFGKEYVIEFIPKNTMDLAFNGYLKVLDRMWALSEISTKVPLDANLNYINKMEIFQTFVPINDTLTFFDINELITEMKITKDNALVNLNFTAILDKRTLYSDTQLNITPIKHGKEDSILNIIIPPPEVTKSDTLLAQLRPEELLDREKKAIVTIDSINNTWKIKTVDATSRMFLTGYIPGKNFDLGPYLELIKHNKVEGYRVTLSGRTSPNLTKNTMLYGHIGYGAKDHEWKYGIGVDHKFNGPFRRIISFDYRNDLSRVGDNRSIFLIKENMMVTGEDNVIASFFTRSPIDKLSREISYRAEYKHEWKRGFTNTISFNNRTIYSGQYIPFVQNGKSVNCFSTNEITIGARFSWEEAITDNYCRRYYLTTQYPIANLRLTGGRYTVGDISNNYLITRAVIKHDVNIGITKFKYIFEGGITLGTVPFPLLEIHRSNQSVGYALYSFNMMKEMEFASDRFISLMPEYHLNGLLFNRVPLLKRLGFREVFAAKFLWSHLDIKHQQILEFPTTLRDARNTYSELSAGIENIFQYFRVDVVFRLTENEIEKNIPIGIRGRFDFTF